MDIIRELEEKAASGDYIFRGEAKHFEKITSSLYREFKDYSVFHCFAGEIEAIQDMVLEMITDSQMGPEDGVQQMALIQHLGGKSNLIDFSTDYRVALYFACEEKEYKDEDGRVIVYPRKIQTTIVIPKYPINRIRSQKSILVEPYNCGIIEPSWVDIIDIPKNYKPLIIKCLAERGISKAALFNDSLGNIVNATTDFKPFKDFYAGFQQQTNQKYKEAIDLYSSTLRRVPKHVPAINNIGTCFYALDNYEAAIRCLDKAIQINQYYAEAYYNRGLAYSGKKKYSIAKIDYKIAREYNKYTWTNDIDKNLDNKINIAMREAVETGCESRINQRSVVTCRSIALYQNDYVPYITPHIWRVADVRNKLKRNKKKRH